jgi:DNA polymerase elongation subunit (family B)
MVREDEHTFYLTKSVSFLGTECPFSEAKYFFFGVPYDLTSSFRPGSRFGPDSVRRFSANIEANSYRKQFNTERAKVYDGGDIVYTPRLSTMLRRVHQVVKTAVSAGKTPVMVGGEHTFTLPAVHATLKKPSALIVFDAHFDLRDEYAGLKLNHATYLRRLLNRRPDISVLVVGVRGYDPSEEQYAVEKGVRFVKSYEAEDVSRLSRLMEFKGGEFSIEVFDDEASMLARCFEILEQYPIVVTFNGDDFDLPYLRNRAEKLGIPKNKIPITLGREGASLRRGIHLDLYRFFNNKSVQVYAFDNRYREFTLDGIAKALLGVGKISLEKPLGELKLQELADYSYRDSRLLRDMVEANDRLILRLMAVISRISKMPLEDVCRHGVSGWIKNLLYWELRGLNWLIPRKEDLVAAKGETKTKAVIEGKKYRGGMVVEPVPGVHFDVTVLDFASLYPSILKEYNLSFETINCPHPECRVNKIPETDHWVCGKRQGLQSRLIGVIRDIRVKWYKPMASDKKIEERLRSWYEVVQRALKVFLNASYGVLGFEEFPLYCPPLAESTTAIGRHVFKTAVEKANSLQVQVIYGDTDSIFLRAKDVAQVRELIKWAKEVFRLELELDKFYRYVVFSRRKKNYLGVTDKGVVDVKGLTAKKRNIPVFIKEAFEDVLRQLAEVKTAEDLEKVKRNIRETIASWYSKLKNRTFEIDQLASGL